VEGFGWVLTDQRKPARLQSAGATTALPVTLAVSGSDFRIEGRPEPEAGKEMIAVDECGSSYEASISEQDGEGRFVLVEFVLGNGRMFDQSLNTKLSDQLSLRHS
jgi:hypothetical protein